MLDDKTDTFSLLDAAEQQLSCAAEWEHSGLIERLEINPSNRIEKFDSLVERLTQAFNTSIDIDSMKWYEFLEVVKSFADPAGEADVNRFREFLIYRARIAA